MSALIHQRCWNHAQREAVARCPECRHDYCRECVTEHEDRLLCAACLKRRIPAGVERGRRMWGMSVGLPALLGLLVAWLFFYGIGRVLLVLPSALHEGTVWHAESPEDL